MDIYLLDYRLLQLEQTPTLPPTQKNAISPHQARSTLKQSLINLLDALYLRAITNLSLPIAHAKNFSLWIVSDRDSNVLLSLPSPLDIILLKNHLLVSNQDHFNFPTSHLSLFNHNNKENGVITLDLICEQLINYITDFRTRSPYFNPTPLTSSNNNNNNNNNSLHHYSYQRTVHIHFISLELSGVLIRDLDLNNNNKNKHHQPALPASFIKLIKGYCYPSFYQVTLSSSLFSTNDYAHDFIQNSLLKMEEEGMSSHSSFQSSLLNFSSHQHSLAQIQLSLNQLSGYFPANSITTIDIDHLTDLIMSPIQFYKPNLLRINFNHIIHQCLENEGQSLSATMLPKSTQLSSSSKLSSDYHKGLVRDNIKIPPIQEDFIDVLTNFNHCPPVTLPIPQVTTSTCHPGAMIFPSSHTQQISTPEQRGMNRLIYCQCGTKLKQTDITASTTLIGPGSTITTTPHLQQQLRLEHSSMLSCAQCILDLEHPSLSKQQDEGGDNDYAHTPPTNLPSTPFIPVSQLQLTPSIYTPTLNASVLGRISLDKIGYKNKINISTQHNNNNHHHHHCNNANNTHNYNTTCYNNTNDIHLSDHCNHNDIDNNSKNNLYSKSNIALVSFLLSLPQAQIHQLYSTLSLPLFDLHGIYSGQFPMIPIPLEREEVPKKLLVCQNHPSGSSQLSTNLMGLVQSDGTLPLVTDLFESLLALNLNDCMKVGDDADNLHQNSINSHKIQWTNTPIHPLCTCLKCHTYRNGKKIIQLATTLYMTHSAFILSSNFTTTTPMASSFYELIGSANATTISTSSSFNPQIPYFPVENRYLLFSRDGINLSFQYIPTSEELFSYQFYHQSVLDFNQKVLQYRSLHCPSLGGSFPKSQPFTSTITSHTTGMTMGDFELDRVNNDNYEDGQNENIPMSKNNNLLLTNPLFSNQANTPLLVDPFLFFIADFLYIPNLSPDLLIYSSHSMELLDLHIQENSQSTNTLLNQSSPTMYLFGQQLAKGTSGMINNKKNNNNSHGISHLNHSNSLLYPLGVFTPESVKLPVQPMQGSQGSQRSAQNIIQRKNNSHHPPTTIEHTRRVKSPFESNTVHEAPSTRALLYRERLISQAQQQQRSTSQPFLNGNNFSPSLSTGSTQSLVKSTPPPSQSNTKRLSREELELVELLLNGPMSNNDTNNDSSKVDLSSMILDARKAEEEERIKEKRVYNPNGSLTNKNKSVVFSSKLQHSLLNHNIDDDNDDNDDGSDQENNSSFHCSF